MENDTFTWESVGGLEAYDHGTRKTRNDCMTNEGYTCPMKCISYFLSGQKGIHPNIQKKQ
jgi:hypothetical protein